MFNFILAVFKELNYNSWHRPECPHQAEENQLWLQPQAAADYFAEPN